MQNLTGEEQWKVFVVVVFLWREKDREKGKERREKQYIYCNIRSREGERKSGVGGNDLVPGVLVTNGREEKGSERGERKQKGGQTP